MGPNSSDILTMLNGQGLDPSQGQSLLISGAGIVPAPPGQNEDNAYSCPPVEVGSYGFIIPQMFPNVTITNIDSVPTSFQNWGEYAVDGFDASGLIGGGFTGDIPQTTNGPVLYYDETTGLFVMLDNGSGSGQTPGNPV